MRSLIMTSFLCTMICLVTASAQMADNASAPEDRTALMAKYKELVQNGAAESANPEVQKQYLDTVLALEYYDLAANVYEEQLKNTPDDPALLRALGEAWMKSGPYGTQKAFEALQKSASIAPDSTDTLILLANLYHREGLYEQAAQYYEKITAIDVAHVQARLGKAVLAVRSGNIAAASEIMNQIGVAAQPYDIQTRIMLRKALLTFERTGGWFEDTAANHAAYAKLLYRAGRITDAVLAAKRSVTLNEVDYETWNFIAAMQLQVGNLEHAEQAYGHSLTARPDQPEIEKQRRQIIDELTRRNMNQKP